MVIVKPVRSTMQKPAQEQAAAKVQKKKNHGNN